MTPPHIAYGPGLPLKTEVSVAQHLVPTVSLLSSHIPIACSFHRKDGFGLFFEAMEWQIHL